MDPLPVHPLFVDTTLLPILGQVASSSRRTYKKRKQSEYSEIRLGIKTLGTFNTFSWFGKVYGSLLCSKYGDATEFESYINASGNNDLSKFTATKKTEKSEKFRFKELDLSIKDCVCYL